MRKLLIAFFIGVLFSPCSFSQITGTSLLISGGNENHDSSIRVISKNNDDESSISLNLKQTNSFLLTTDDYWIGYAVELEFKTSNKIGVTVSLNPFFSVNNGSKNATWISAGPKFYFTESNLRGFAGVQGSLAFRLDKGLMGIAIVPSLGLNYRISKNINIGTESQLNVGIGIGSYFVFFSVNPFVRIVF